jgi:hypothetical protein
LTKSLKCATQSLHVLPDIGLIGERLPARSAGSTMGSVPEPAEIGSHEDDPLRPIAGVLWGALAGGALWLMALAIIWLA